MKSAAFLSLVLLATVSGKAMAQCTTGQITSTGVTEFADVNFNGLIAGQSVSAGGLTLNCTTGSPNGVAVATFFDNEANGSTGPAVPPTGCSKSGALNGWSTGGRTGSVVRFTSATPNAPVTDISVTGTFGLVTTTQGVYSLTSLLTGSLVCGRPAAGYPIGPGFSTADRWQEQHRGGGLLYDYKRGVGNAVDPEKQVGTYSFSGTASTVTYDYGSPPTYTWTVYLFLTATPYNIYSFCLGTAEHVRAYVRPGQGSSGNGCGGSFPPFPP